MAPTTSFHKLVMVGAKADFGEETQLSLELEKESVVISFNKF